MANIKSAKKRIGVIEKKTALNRVRKSQIKTAIKRLLYMHRHSENIGIFLMKSRVWLMR